MLGQRPECQARRSAVPLILAAAAFVAMALLAGGQAAPSASAQSAAWPSLGLLPGAAGLNSPVGLTNAGDGSNRLFAVEQRGKIRIVKGASLVSAPFLDISAKVSCCGEQGLLSVAFPPGYQSKGYFYVDYTNTSSDTVVERYRVTSNPDVADPNSAQLILTVDQPFSNHNGGQLQFGPDGYLYIGLGDGGSGDDPGNRAQSLGTLLGKILRVDVESTPDQPGYKAPPNNPFNGTPDAQSEIWAYGLRNPWRFSFDVPTGDLYIGDVGQNQREEIDYQPAGSTGGQNYGWRVYEGTRCNQAATGDPCDPAGKTMPVAEYTHDDGCSVTGGAVYRGSAYPSLTGIYFYGDFCLGKLWGLRRVAGAWQSTMLLDSGRSISSFGTDENGNLYLTDYSNGLLYQLVNPSESTATPTATATSAPSATPTPTSTASGGNIFTFLPFIGK